LPGFFGTPVFIVGQTIRGGDLDRPQRRRFRWDPDFYPFILLNLPFSLQAAYFAPLILLAQTRQADRDKALSEADAQHREALATASTERQQIAEHQAQSLRQLLETNTTLTEQNRALTTPVEVLARAIHDRICQP
jgi:uncharacterized membrane protein